MEVSILTSASVPDVEEQPCPYVVTVSLNNYSYFLRIYRIFELISIDEAIPDAHFLY